jgi:hypothetical protein
MGQGLLTHVMNFMQIAGRTMTSTEKLVVLHLMKLKLKVRYYFVFVRSYNASGYGSWTYWKVETTNIYRVYY